MSKKRRKKKILIKTDDLYKFINKAQLSGKKVSFSSNLNDAVTFENILRDLALKYNKTDLKTKANFVVFPLDLEEVIDIDAIEDDFLGKGMLFDEEDEKDNNCV